MELKHQRDTINQLKKFAENNVHSIIIYGFESSGKTYLAKQYASFLGIDDFQIISPNVSELRETIDQCMRLDTQVVLCIENLDTGVFGASSTLLKFLEDVSPRIYVIVTARNIKYIQPTIISRCQTVEVNPPTTTDLMQYANAEYSQAQVASHSSSPVWGALKTYNDINTFIAMDRSAIDYMESIPSICLSGKCVSDMVWALQKYPENSGDTPIKLVIRYIIHCYPQLLAAGISCIRDLELRRIASYAIITKFVFILRETLRR